MSLVTKPSIVAQMIVDKLKDNANTIGMTSGNVYYGDRVAIPEYPAISVEVVDAPRTVRFVTRTEYYFAAYIMVYFGRYDDAETTRKQADEYAEKVVDVLNSDIHWKDSNEEDRLISAWVTRLEPGYANRGVKVYAARITWEAKSIGPLVGP